MLAISGGASLAPPPELAGATATRAIASTPRIDKISDLLAGGGVQATVDRARKIDWPAQFRTLGSNYFEFVVQAAPAAYDGNGAAQYYIGRALERCEETNALYQDADDPAQAVSHLAMLPTLREHERQELLDCRQLLTGTAFGALPARSSGYPAAYWKSRAIDNRYPVALVSAALESPTPAAVQILAAALATGDAEAMLLFGWTRADVASADEPAAVVGAAWVLAACISNAANCKSAFDALPIIDCEAEIESVCRERFSAMDELSSRLSAQAFKKAQQLATEIQTDLQSHEASRLIKHLAF
jgi:hypothetical protein